LSEVNGVWSRLQKALKGPLHTAISQVDPTRVIRPNVIEIEVGSELQDVAEIFADRKALATLEGTLGHLLGKPVQVRFEVAGE